MAEKATSVGQVYTILQQALNLNEYISRSIDAWAKIFETETNNPELISKISHIFELINNAKKEITHLEKTPASMGLDTLNRIESLILVNITGSWQPVRNGISQDMMSIVSLCDELLKSKGYGYLRISKLEIAELKTQVDKLIEEFIDSNLPDEFKLSLIAELRKIQEILINFYITGEAAVKQVCNEVIGGIITKASEKPQLYKQFKQSVQKVLNTAVMIGGLMTTYDLSIKYQPLLADQIINLIENMPDKANETQLQLEATSEPQQMDAEIENNTTHQYLSSGEEE